MLTEEDRFITENAYVPEHVVALMTGISGGEYGRDRYYVLKLERFVVKGRLRRETTRRAVVIDGRDGTGALTAFYVVDLGKERFATYVAGCHSKAHYEPHASDILFLRMVQLAQEGGKEYIHLGLNVTEGMRCFKVKWGGEASLTYECGRWRTDGPWATADLLSRL